ncbi:hypothetical protein TPB0596_27800 [Tsukamurella pulmonis]|uniref:uridine kinase n=1 Tax=Tsukamurella pulmonis TaxID=47312 RepID=UPI001EE00F3D|nr:uridine kinase [Tsukamurella pulmonis]BDD83017.1 hypothetical protein TPB0596_27800 [Tsukamurella pulmonis]
MTRREVLTTIADRLADHRWRRLAVDGVDGVGKTTFADELALLLDERAIPTQLIHVDDHLNPPEFRHRRGRDSPEGFWRDSVNVLSLRAAVLGAPERCMVEGIFLHGEELMDLWDTTIYLHAPFDVTVPRSHRRDATEGRPIANDHRRYVDGQRLYLAACSPAARATFLIDNSSIDAPVIIADRS